MAPNENEHLLAGASNENGSRKTKNKSMPYGMDTMRQTENGFDGGGLPTRSYSVSGDGSLSYLTPLQMGRHELYEFVPYVAVFGLQKKERSLSQAFASYAADLDVLEAEHAATADKRTLSDVEKIKRHSHASLLLLDELELDKAMVTTPLVFAVMVASLSQFVVGYNTGVMNAPEAVVFKGHSIAMWSLAVSAFAIGGPFGSAVGGTLADTRGRRGALLIDIWTFLIGGIVQTFALDMFSIIVSRFIIGFASGLSSVLVPIYLGELAPPNLRGKLGTMTQFALVIGILVSNVLAFPFATEKLWRILFAITPVITIMQLLCAPYLLESPRWLLGRDPDSKRARFIIKKLRGLRYDHEVETEANHYISASRVQDCDDEHELNSNETVMEMFRNPKIRLLFISCLVLQMGQQFSGINAVFYYSNMFFDGVIEDPLVGTTAVGAVNVIFTYIALLMMDSYGRRTLILWSSGGMFFSCIVIVLALKGVFNNYVALAAVNGYVAFFEIGMGPIPWLIVAEMFDAKYVTTAMSACCQLNWACNFVIGLVFPYLNASLGPYCFVPFAAVLLFVFGYTFFVLPETQGTTPEELQAELVRKNSCTQYHNINIENTYASPIDQEWKIAMEQLKQEEEQAMNAGTYNYGFQHIDKNSGNVQQPPIANAQVQASDWGSNVTGNP